MFLIRQVLGGERYGGTRLTFSLASSGFRAVNGNLRRYGER